MVSFAEWLDRVLEHGESVLAKPPVHESGQDKHAIAVLEAAFARHCLDVGGPRLTLDPRVALDAARCLADACWSVVAPEAVEFSSRLTGEPRGPSEHLSADVMLRFLPAVYRRAAAKSLDSPLAIEIAAILRRWPLSGVLADLREPPFTDLEFGGHSGLHLLYAERLVGHVQSSWIPNDGMTRQRVDLVFAEHKRMLPHMVPVETSRD